MVIPTGTPEEEARWLEIETRSLIRHICNNAGAIEKKPYEIPTHTRALTELMQKAKPHQIESMQEILTEYSASISFEQPTAPLDVRNMLYAALTSYQPTFDRPN